VTSFVWVAATGETHELSDSEADALVESTMAEALKRVRSMPRVVAPAPVAAKPAAVWGQKPRF
jgi:hypothetical protein